LKGIETFEAPIMVLSDDGIFWCADDEEEDWPVHPQSRI
jgi:hypothetical protein